MALILLLALIGYWTGGLRGLIFGAAAGYAITRVLPMLLRRGLTAIQSQFITSTFAVVGAVCKADGVVTPDEIAATEQLFVRFHLTPEQTRDAKAAFQKGKSTDFDLDLEVDRFARAARGNRVLYQMFLRVQMMAVVADGQVHPAEQQMLVRIARRLGYSDFEVAQLEALLRAVANAAAGGRAPGPERPTPRQSVEDAYAVLGVRPDASEAELKRAYRKLIAENHPDKVAAKGLPESMRELAEERAREINAAYAVIKKVRGFA